MTFLLYSVLPQLRDLTGKFILGICGFSVSAFALTLIDIFGVADKNVHRLTTGNRKKTQSDSKYIVYLFCIDRQWFRTGRRFLLLQPKSAQKRQLLKSPL